MSLQMNDLELNPPYADCPHCGYDEFYTMERVSGVVNIYRTFDGKLSDNAEMYDHTNLKLIRKYAYCGECHKRLFKVID